MRYDTVQELALTCHPDTAPAAHAVRARVGRDSGVLAVRYTIEGELARLRVPPARKPAALSPLFTARLWEHTCCEIFFARAGAPNYYELNFSPSGEWAAQAFERYRESKPFQGEAPERELIPELTVRRASDELAIEVRIRLAWLMPELAAAPLSVALAAVLEAADGSLSYWALRHPPGRPDFHHSAGYALELTGSALPSARTAL